MCETLEERVQALATEVIGMERDQALDHARSLGIRCRIMHEEGQFLLHTADSRLDRIGIYVESGRVTKAEVG